MFVWLIEEGSAAAAAVMQQNRNTTEPNEILRILFVTSCISLPRFAPNSPHSPYRGKAPWIQPGLSNRQSKFDVSSDGST